MRNYLVTFAARGGHLGTVYGSYVLLIGRAPRTQRDYFEIQTILSMERDYEGLDIQVQGVTELPYQDNSRPGNNGPFGYYLMYAIVSPPDGFHLAHLSYARPTPIHSLKDLRKVEQRLLAGRPDTYVRLTMCSKLPLTSDQLEDVDLVDE